MLLEDSSLQKHTHLDATKSIPKTTKQRPREVQLHGPNNWKQPNMEIQDGSETQSNNKEEPFEREEELETLGSLIKAVRG